ncbi:SulP family inorganic anion transporter [Paenibacillus thermotolerans]|uniref:SulP family inorganic anion transporter n=1 Tax=Paenibacillus thermotolerans TaxID=3027807 RepID=UPI0030825FA4
MKAFFKGRYEGYDLAQLRKDVLSGILVGIIAIPLGMAFAIASGVDPEYGLYTVIVAGILISLLGGSRFQIGGPTGAFIPILLAIVLHYGYAKLLTAGFLAGAILLVLGLCRAGKLITLIPKPVIVGFTAGIAVIIFSGQIGNFLGMTGLKSHEYFTENMREIIMHFSSMNGYGLLIAVICLACIVGCRLFLPKVPAPLIGLAVSSAAAAIFLQGKVATIGSVYGIIPDRLPGFMLPDLSLGTIGTMLAPAFAIALLGGVESLLSAVVADEMTGTKHSSNRELIGQGIANMITPLFGGIPATGAIARTATNIKSGGKSPISGIIHGLTVLLILVSFAPIASAIPLAALAPILMVVAWNMSERKHVAHILKTRSAEAWIMAVTFLLTVFFNLVYGVAAGLIVSVIVYVYRTKLSKPLQAASANQLNADTSNPRSPAADSVQVVREDVV